jgi:malate dehydrogenase (quinone)
VERYGQLAQVNSKASSNSQTIHCGDIETNYTLEKALKVKRTADMIERYAALLAEPERNRCVFRTPKMVLAVGEPECSALRRRFDLFSPHFPAMEWLDKEQIAEWEPHVARLDGARAESPCGRNPLGRSASAAPPPPSTTRPWPRASWTRPALPWLDRALPDRAASWTFWLGNRVESITPETAADGSTSFLVELRPHRSGAGPQGDGAGAPAAPRRIRARHVVVSAGAHSLLMAQQLGFGLEYSCLPVAGSFYFTPDLLRGKVYTVQNDKLPFAAIHGDPDVRAPGQTRFGPTALLLPLLERYRPASFFEFLKVLRLDLSVLLVFWQLFRMADIRNYILKNLLFEVPWLRRRLFLADARKIVPGLQLADLRFAEGFGGAPPVNSQREKRLMLGEARIAAMPGLAFNVTPSPGGTCCLGNAVTDLEAIVARLGCRFDRQRLEQELYGSPSPSASGTRTTD